MSRFPIWSLLNSAHSVSKGAIVKLRYRPHRAHVRELARWAVADREPREMPNPIKDALDSCARLMLPGFPARQSVRPGALEVEAGWEFAHAPQSCLCYADRPLSVPAWKRSCSDPAQFSSKHFSFESESRSTNDRAIRDSRDQTRQRRADGSAPRCLQARAEGVRRRVSSMSDCRLYRDPVRVFSHSSRLRQRDL